MILLASFIKQSQSSYCLHPAAGACAQLAGGLLNFFVRHLFCELSRSPEAPPQKVNSQPSIISAPFTTLAPIPNRRAVPAAFLMKVRRERLAAGVDVVVCGLLGSVFICGIFVLVVYSKLFRVGPRRAAPRKRALSPSRGSEI